MSVSSVGSNVLSQDSHIDFAMKRHPLLFTICTACIALLQPDVHVQMASAFPVKPQVHDVNRSLDPRTWGFRALSPGDPLAQIGSNKFGSSALFGAFGPPPDIEEGPKGPDP